MSKFDKFKSDDIETPKPPKTSKKEKIEVMTPVNDSDGDIDTDDEETETTAPITTTAAGLETESITDTTDEKDFFEMLGDW